MNHPLQQLYTQVDAAKYWHYLYDLCLEVTEKEEPKTQTEGD